HARTKLSALRESLRPAMILGDTNREARAGAGAFYGGYAFKGDAATRSGIPPAAQPQAFTPQVTDGSTVNLYAAGKQVNEPAAIAGEQLGQLVEPPPVVPSRGKAKLAENSRASTPSLGDVPILGREFRSRASGLRPNAPSPNPTAPATVPPPAAPLARDAEGRTDARGLARQRLIAGRENLGRQEAGKPALDEKAMKETVAVHSVEAVGFVAGKPISANVVEGESVGRKTGAAEFRGVAVSEEKPASVPPAQLEAKLERAKDSEADIAAKKVPATTPPTPQPEVSARDNAFSTFSLNVSDVSFKLAGASLESGAMPDPASIRVEEFVNAFNYRDPAPQPGARLAFAWERARYPFAHNRDVLRFSIQTAARGREPQKPLNLVILLDNSGSMERPDRVAILREALSVLARLLGPQDRISVIAFARTARLWVDGMAGGNREALLAAMLDLNPQGGTNLEDALDLGYATALRYFMAQGVNRVILLTDGAANLGNVEPEALKQKVVAHRQKGIALDCFGIGWEGYNDDLLEVLSRNGDGRYGFLNEPEQAAPEFADQLAGALNVAAADVKTQVEFNPFRVDTWRQIGYAKHQLTQEQFRDNTVDAAEIAAAESGNALYVIQVNPQGSGPIGVVRVRCKVPETGEYVEQAWPLPYQPAVPALDQASPALRLAVASAALGEWLSRSPYAAEVTLNALQAYLAGVPEVFAPDPRPERLGWMIRQAQALAGK
ncbi:MAG: von Willebrand factor type A domain-containing protein, partial [Verrucomicrobiota bacterium]